MQLKFNPINNHLNDGISITLSQNYLLVITDRWTQQGYKHVQVCIDQASYRGKQ